MALAIVLSRLGHKVVLVDSDMRRPAMHANLGLANAHGLSNYLAGDNEWENLLQRSPIANIDFMRSEEHTSELQSLMRISYAVFCLKKKNIKIQEHYILISYTVTT